jgi:amidase
MGYVGWIGTFEGRKGTGKEKVFESEMVRELRNLGAILYCKTSVPHTLMTGETVNNIIGYTWNPKNRHLTSGGSSGGEGALIGLKGSPIGFGSDIGGSIRIPAGFNGLYGIRPSSGRMPYEGMANSMVQQPSPERAKYQFQPYYFLIWSTDSRCNRMVRIQSSPSLGHSRLPSAP